MCAEPGRLPVVRYSAVSVVLLFRLGFAVQEHAGDDAFRAAAAGLLAVEPASNFTLKVLAPAWWRRKFPLFVLTVGSCVATALVPEK